MARALRAWAIKRRGKNSVRNFRYGPQTRLVRGMFARTVPCASTAYVHENKSKKPEIHRYCKHCQCFFSLAGITRLKKSKINTLTFPLSVHVFQKVHTPHVFNKNIKLNFRTLQGQETNLCPTVFTRVFVSLQPSQEYEKQESISFLERTTDILVYVALLPTKLALSYKYTRIFQKHLKGIKLYCCKVSKFEHYTKKYNTVDKSKQQY